MRVGLDLITRNWMLKLAALGLAVLLWSVTRTETETPTRVEIAGAVDVALRDPDWTLARPPEPDQVGVVFSMPAGEPLLIGERPRVIVPVDEVEDSVEVRELRVEWVRLRGDLDPAWIEEIRPNQVSLAFERIIERDLPVAIRTRGELPTGYRMSGSVEARPATVRVSGGTSRVDVLDSIPLEPVVLTGLRDTATVRAALDTSDIAGLDVDPDVVRVTVPVVPLASDTVVAGARQVGRRARPPAPATDGAAGG